MKYGSYLQNKYYGICYIISDRYLLPEISLKL